MLKYKHIEASRELRLWLGQVIIPGAVAFGMVMSNPQFKSKVDEKVCTAKEKLQSLFAK